MSKTKLPLQHTSLWHGV